MTASHELAPTMADYAGRDELFVVGPFTRLEARGFRDARGDGEQGTQQRPPGKCMPLQAP